MQLLLQGTNIRVHCHSLEKQGVQTRRNIVKTERAGTSRSVKTVLFTLGAIVTNRLLSLFFALLLTGTLYGGGGTGYSAPSSGPSPNVSVSSQERPARLTQAHRAHSLQPAAIHRIERHDPCTTNSLFLCRDRARRGTFHGTRSEIQVHSPTESLKGSRSAPFFMSER
jgi:hypothetical protein